jgi:DNA-binding transcriptional LysR family regulator
VLENRHYRYFIEVAKTLHVTRAAERLNIAQPALTQNIQQLESELKVQLFHRKGRRLTLTEAGTAFLREAEQSLQQFDHAQRTAQCTARGEVGKFVFGFGSTAGISVVPQLLQRFRQSYPDVELILCELGTVAQKHALRTGEIDIALMYTVPDDEFVYHELVPQSLVIALPEDHPLAGRDSIALKDLEHETFLLAPPDVSEVMHNAVLSECADAGFIPKRVQEITTTQTALGLVAAHFGIAVIPISSQVLTRKGVVLRPIRNSRIQVRLALFWPKQSPSPIVQNLLKCIDP